MKYKIEFRRDRIVLAANNGSIVALKRAGAYVRQSTRNSIRRSDNSSTPGSPPHTRHGLLKRSILFGVDKAHLKVFIGPGHRFVGVSMTAHEYGGNYMGRRYPKRPLMKPVLLKTAKELLKLWKNAVK